METKWEKFAWDNNQLLMGVDEVAYGNLFGSLFIAAVVFPPGFSFSFLRGLRDSKKLKDNVRFNLEPIIKREALWWCCESVSSQIIDSETAYHSKYRVISEAINAKAAGIGSTIVLMDGNVSILNLSSEFSSHSLVKGDSLCKTISAASIIAKCSQRRYIMKEAKKYPEYDLDKNNGYWSKQHEAAILKYGATPNHRMSYLKKILCRNE